MELSLEPWNTMENVETTPNDSFGSGNLLLTYFYVTLLNMVGNKKISFFTPLGNVSQHTI